MLQLTLYTVFNTATYAGHQHAILHLETRFHLSFLSLSVKAIAFYLISVHFSTPRIYGTSGPGCEKPSEFVTFLK